MRVHFLYQILSLIKLFDIWERQQGMLFSTILYDLTLYFKKSLVFIF